MDAALINDPKIPTIGNPIKVLGYTLIAFAQCQCSPGDPLKVIVDLEAGTLQAMRSACPRCQNIYSVQAMGLDSQGRLGFTFNVEKPAIQ